MGSLKNTFFRYLPVSPGDKLWGLYVPTAGYIWSGPHMDYPLAQHPTGYHYHWKWGRVLQEFQVLYVTRGEGIFESAAAGKRNIKAGDAFIVCPGVWHRYAPNPEIGWDEYWIGFDGTVPRNLLRKGCFRTEEPVFRIGLTNRWREPFVQAIELLQTEPLGYAQMLAGLTFQILAQLHVCDRNEKLGGAPDDAVIRKTKYLVMERLTCKVDCEGLARELHVSYSWLRHTFRQHTGFSLHQYQLQLRLNRAKSLLSGTGLSIKQVAHETGFECPYHFSHLFKRKTGTSPEAWRNTAHGGAPSEGQVKDGPTSTAQEHRVRGNRSSARNRSGD